LQVGCFFAIPGGAIPINSSFKRPAKRTDPEKGPVHWSVLFQGAPLQAGFAFTKSKNMAILAFFLIKTKQK
jgi:hypothetical protein